MAKGVKTGGRQKGVCNKVTKDIRLLLDEYLTEEISNIPNLLKELEPKDRLDLMVKLLPYVIPKYDQVVYNTKPINRGDFFWEVNQKLIENSSTMNNKNNTQNSNAKSNFQ